MVNSINTKSLTRLLLFKLMKPLLFQKKKATISSDTRSKDEMKQSSATIWKWKAILCRVAFLVPVTTRNVSKIIKFA